MRDMRGITLISLIITIILLLILAGIGINAGIPTINLAEFTQFKDELKILQTKVNELNQKKETEIGTKELTENQKNIISENIANTNNEIISGFRYCSSEYIQNNLGINTLERDYLINIEYRYVIAVEGYEYKGKKYYMINQLSDGPYNVEYNNKNPGTGDFGFELDSSKESDRWKIEVINIKYPGYISNWKVQYRLADDEKWKTANGLNFYVSKEGNYYVQLTHDDINLGSKLITIIEESEENSNIINNNI